MADNTIDYDWAKTEFAHLLEMFSGYNRKFEIIGKVLHRLELHRVAVTNIEFTKGYEAGAKYGRRTGEDHIIANFRDSAVNCGPSSRCHLSTQFKMSSEKDNHGEQETNSSTERTCTEREETTDKPSSAST